MLEWYDTMIQWYWYNDTMIDWYNDTMHMLSKTACKHRQSVTLLCTILYLWSRSKFLFQTEQGAVGTVCSELAQQIARRKSSRHLRWVTADMRGTDRSLNDAGPIMASSLLQGHNLNTLYSWYTVKHKSERPKQIPLHLSSTHRFSAHHSQRYLQHCDSSFSNTR